MDRSAKDWFPGLPTGALVAQMELLSQTLAFRSQHPVMDAQQVLAAQLQYYQPLGPPLGPPLGGQQGPPPGIAALEAALEAAHQAAHQAAMAPAPTSVAKLPAQAPAAAPGPFYTEDGRIYWRACNRGSDTCACRYWVVDGKDAHKRPDIDPQALHLSSLRKKRKDPADVAALLQERGIPFVRIDAGDEGFANVFFETHGDAVAAYLFFVSQQMNVNFKRVLKGRGRSRKNGKKH